MTTENLGPALQQLSQYLNDHPQGPTLLKSGSRGPAVTALQTLLDELRYFDPQLSREADKGKYGKSTRAAVKKLAGNKGTGAPFTVALARKLIDQARAASHRYVVSGPQTGEDKGATGTNSEDGDKDTTGVNSTGKPKPKPSRPPSPPAKPTEAPATRGLTVSTGVTARLLDVTPTGQTLEYWCWAACTEMMVRYLRSCPDCGSVGHRENDITQAQQANRRLLDSTVDCRKVTTESDYEVCDRGGWPYFYEFEDAVQSTMWGSRRHVLEEHGLQLLEGGPRLRVRGKLGDWQLRNLAENSGREFARRLDDAEGAALSWEMLTGLLDHDRPILSTIRFPHPGRGHMRVAAGYAVTPGNQRWVAVLDPLPPRSGDWHLIPYEFYVEGPGGGHWRDYWVPPDLADPKSPLLRRAEELQVGRELVASYIEYPDNTRQEDPAAAFELSKKDLEAARAEARKGLVAVQAIARDAKELALALGMGGNFLQVFGRALIPQLSAKGITAEAPLSAAELAWTGRASLVLDEETYIPIHEIYQEKLRKWDPPTDKKDKEYQKDFGRSVKKLLGKPREIIFQVKRPDAAPFPFFAAVTVRRTGDRWRLASLGKIHLMATLATRQFLSSFGKILERLMTEGFNLERLVRHLAALGLIEPIVRQMSDGDVRDWAGALGYPPEDVDRYLWPPDGVAPAQGTPKKRGPLHIEKLLHQAAEFRNRLREEHKALRSDKLETFRKELGSDAMQYHADVWKKRTEWARERAREKEPWQVDQLALLETVAKRLEASSLPGPDDQWRATDGAALAQLVGDLEKLAGWDKDKLSTQLSRLDELVRHEAKIQGLCAGWKSDGGDQLLIGLFDAERDQEIAWRHLVADSGPGFLEPPGTGLGDLLYDRQLYREASRPEGDDLEARIEIERPAFILDVQDLYQLLIGYPNEEGESDLESAQFESVYPQSFHRPGRRVEAEKLADVLKQLQKVAHERDA